MLVVAPGEEVVLTAPEAGARVEAALDGGPLHVREQPLTAPAAGDHWLTLASRDEVGNLSELSWIRLRVDGEGPALELGFDPEPVTGRPGGPRWLPPGANARLRAVDELAGVLSVDLALREDPASDGAREQAEGVEVSLPLPADGGFELEARAADRVGNESRRTVSDLAVDSTPPSAELQWQGPRVETASGPVAAPSLRLTLRVDDAESGLGEWTPTIDGRHASLADFGEDWPAGAHAVGVEAADRVGNQATLGPWRFTIDGAGPEITWRVTSAGVSSADGRLFHQGEVTLEASASDAPAGLASLEAGDEAGGLRPVEGPLRASGGRLLLRARDRVGNASEVEARWLLDEEPPTARLLAPDGRAAEPGETLKLTLGEAVELRAEDSGVGLERATYRLNRSRALPLPETLRPEFTGRVLLTVEASDRFGHRSVTSWYLKVEKPGREG